MLIRDDVGYRCTVRRNGVPGLGPFRISARKELLRRLLTAQRQSGIKLIRAVEIRKIHSLWAADLESNTYVEDILSASRLRIRPAFSSFLHHSDATDALDKTMSKALADLIPS